MVEARKLNPTRPFHQKWPHILGRGSPRRIAALCGTSSTEPPAFTESSIRRQLFRWCLAVNSSIRFRAQQMPNRQTTHSNGALALPALKRVIRVRTLSQSAKALLPPHKCACSHPQYGEA